MVTVKHKNKLIWKWKIELDKISWKEIIVLCLRADVFLEKEINRKLFFHQRKWEVQFNGGMHQ